MVRQIKVWSFLIALIMLEIERKHIFICYTYTIFIFFQFFLLSCFNWFTAFLSSIYKKLQFLHHNSSPFLLNSCNYCSCFWVFIFSRVDGKRSRGREGQNEKLSGKLLLLIFLFKFISFVTLLWRFFCFITFLLAKSN